MMSNVLLIHYAQETDDVNCWNMFTKHNSRTDSLMAFNIQSTKKGHIKKKQKTSNYNK